MKRDNVLCRVTNHQDVQDQSRDWPPYSIPYFVLPGGKTEVDLDVDQFVPYLLGTGDTAIHKPSSSSRCYPVVLSQERESLVKTTIEESNVKEKSDIVDFTMSVRSQLWTLHNERF